MASDTELLPPFSAPRTRIWNSLPARPTSCTSASPSSGLSSAARTSPIGGGALNLTCTLGPPRGEEVVDHARAEHPGRQARQDAEAEGHREAAHGAAAELEQDESRAEGGDVRVADRVPGSLVAGLDRRAHGLPQAQLLADALQDEDVGVDRHADGEHDAGDAREREREAESGERAHQEEDVQQEGPIGDRAA